MSFTIKQNFGCVFYIDALYQVEYIPLSFLTVFLYDIYLILSSDFSVLIERIVRFSFFGLLTRYIELLDFLILNHSDIPGTEPNLIILHCFAHCIC